MLFDHMQVPALNPRKASNCKLSKMDPVGGRPGNEAICYHSNVANQLTLVVVTLILCAGVWIYHIELKASGLWAVFSLSSLQWYNDCVHGKSLLNTLILCVVLPYMR